jgi:predicted lipid carrier protein YhbT
MSQELPTPVILMKSALHTLSPAVLRPGLRLVMRAMRQRHAPLFKRLARLAPATILFDPDDTPHCFLLTIAKDDLHLSLTTAGQTASVRITGSLATLLYLLEGKIDSDTLFFSRDVAVSGDTAVAVGFRNTLDGEQIGLLDDALAAVGPLAAPGKRLVLGIDRRVERLKRRWAHMRDAAHRSAHGGHDPNEEVKMLSAQITELQARLAKLESRGRRGREQTA